MNPLWTQIASRAGITLSDAQHASLAKYLDLLLEANQTMNLTRIVDREQAELLHIADSLTALPLLPMRMLFMADLGSGGGVPGIPLAIARPDVRMLLIESTKKKAAFLRKAVEALGLPNVQVSDERIEDVGNGPKRSTFDVVTARAVALLPWLIEWGIPLLKKGGLLLAMKGERAQDEIDLSGRARGLLRAGDPTIIPADLPGAAGHVIVKIVKTGTTPGSLPRPPVMTKGKHL